MSDWSIETYNNQVNSQVLAKKFSAAFPQRSKKFFLRIINSLNGTNSKLYLLLIDGEIRGAAFAFRISGYEFDVWSPSYLFVEKNYRNVSFLFIINLFRQMSTSIIDVSPTGDVRKILSAMKFEEICKGSLLIPTIQGLVRRPRRSSIIRSLSPIDRFKLREDLEWFGLRSNNCKSFCCVKKTSRFGVSFFVLVYCDKALINGYLVDLLYQIARVNPFAILIVPKLNDVEGFISFQVSKFHSYSNIKELGNVYSLLGSEVTEVL